MPPKKENQSSKINAASLFMEWFKKTVPSFGLHLKNQKENYLYFHEFGEDVYIAIAEDVCIAFDLCLPDTEGEKIFWDMILLADLPCIKKVANGYICEQETCNTKKVYESVDDLMAEHTYKIVLEWLEENLSKTVCYLSIEHESETFGAFGTMVKIVEESEVEKYRNHDRYTFRGSKPLNVPNRQKE